MRRDVFQAIADPTRREIIKLIAGKPLNYHSVAEQFGMSRQAVAKHIGILTACGLIVIKQDGRERYCQAQLKKLGQVSKWLQQYSASWTSKPDGFDKNLSKPAKTIQKAKK